MPISIYRATPIWFSTPAGAWTPSAFDSASPHTLAAEEKERMLMNHLANLALFLEVVAPQAKLTWHAQKHANLAG